MGIERLSTPLEKASPVGFPLTLTHRRLKNIQVMLTKIDLNSKEWLSTKDLENEVWKQTKFPNYAISNYGRLKRIAHTNYRKSTSGKEYSSFIPEKICKIWKNRCGYMIYRVTVDGKLKMVSIHQLVAKAFIPNPNNLPFINHKNEDKSDNRVENLHWCTAKFNSNYGTCQQRRAKTLKNLLAQRVIDINCYTRKGELVKKYHTFGELKEDGFNPKTIYRCCEHKYETTQGYVWRYEGDPFTPLTKNKNANILDRPVVCYNRDAEIVAVYPNIKIAAETLFPDASQSVLKTRRQSISSFCRGVCNSPTVFGYMWRFEGEPVPEPYKDKRDKAIIQCDLSGNEINRFNRIIDAAEAMGARVKASGIQNCLHGKLVTSCGYKWKYANE